MTPNKCAHPVFDDVTVTYEGRSRTTPDKDCFVFEGSTFEDVQAAFEYEAEHCNGSSEAIPASGPVRNGDGTFVLYAKMPAPKQPHEIVRDFLSEINGHFR